MKILKDIKFTKKLSDINYQYILTFNDDTKLIAAIECNSIDDGKNKLQKQYSKSTQLNNFKKSKIKKIKQKCKQLIEQDEWKLFRHRSQKEIKNQKLDLTEKEYQDIIKKHQEYRDKSNNLETQINNASTIEDVEAINWD